MAFVRAIACCDIDGGIGKDGRDLFAIPEDRALFRTLSSGAPVLVGRKTFDMLGPKLARSLGAMCVSRTVPGAIADPRRFIMRYSGLVVVAGGAELYESTAVWWDELFLTIVDAHGDGDEFFPAHGRARMLYAGCVAIGVHDGLEWACSRYTR